MKYGKKKIKINKIIILLIITFIIVISLTRDNYLVIESFFKNMSNQSQMFIQRPFLKKNNNVIDLSLSKEKDIEIKELKKLLGLKQIHSLFDLIYTTSINRNVNLFNDVITIDKGTKDLIRKDMIVINEYGLVGKVNKTTSSSSDIIPITKINDNYQISVVINNDNNQIFGTLNKYDKNNNTFIITGIASSVLVKKNSIVTTSGLGEVFPRGIFIGEVIDSYNDSYGMTKNVVIKSSVDFNDLKYLAVIKEVG